MNKRPVCIIVGVGHGNGAAIAKRFSRAGYNLALLSRSTSFTKPLAQSLPYAQAYACDVTNMNSVMETIDNIQSEKGGIDSLIYNAGKGVWGNIDDISIEEFEQSWKVNTLGAYAVSKAIVPVMRRAGQGNIVFIGATSSRRGQRHTIGFASAKAGQRSLAQSLARDLGSEGIHISLVVIDAIVDLPELREKLPDKPDDFFARPDDIAETVFFLTQQKPSAWTFELEVRPFCEKW